MTSQPSTEAILRKQVQILTESRKHWMGVASDADKRTIEMVERMTKLRGELDAARQQLDNSRKVVDALKSDAGKLLNDSLENEAERFIALQGLQKMMARSPNEAVRAWATDLDIILGGSGE